MDIKRRLTSKDITIREILKMSLQDAYLHMDNKRYRAKLDVVSAKLTVRENYDYNRKTQQWEKTGRDAKLTFVVKTDPVSYHRTDKLKFHYYPVVVLLHSPELGFDSPFKWRTGSLYKPKFPKKGMSKAQRQNIELYNLKHGIQLQFFFELEWVLWKYNLLYGRNWTTRPPRVTNPNEIPFLDKHMYWVVTKVLIHLLHGNGKKILLDKLIESEDERIK